MLYNINQWRNQKKLVRVPFLKQCEIFSMNFQEIELIQHIQKIFAPLNPLSAARSTIQTY